MTLITIAPGVRVLRRHPDRDVLIVEGLGEYATLFIESIPGGWCVVNGEAATKRIHEQVRQCEEVGMEEQKFNEMGQQDVPDLLLEMRRLQVDNRLLSDNLNHVSIALGEHLRPGQTPDCAIKRIVGDLAACVKERDAYRSSAELAADRANRVQAERNKLRLTLLAEQGDINGAPDGWKRTGSIWFRPLGPVNHQVEVRRSMIHPTGEPYHWTLYTPTLSAEGYAPTAREAMKRADNAYQEKA